jgi:hypothetical protein
MDSRHTPPRCRPQQPALPATARERFTAAAAGVFLCFAVFGLFAGAAGACLAGPLHHLSPAPTLLIFALIVGLGILTAAPVLVRAPDAKTQL